MNDNQLLNEINKTKHKVIHTIQLSMSLGIIIGFLIGLVTSSFLHKYIVHPLGW